ncbi:hypothetical protein L195_g045170, partial [Trifolium pratense]
MMGQTLFLKTLELSFSARDVEGIILHDNDPFVIQGSIGGSNGPYYVVHHLRRKRKCEDSE